jgi:DNA (cytosine-5)-methyltransferase 1
MDLAADDAGSYVPSRIRSRNPPHEPWSLTDRERERYREIAKRARDRSTRATLGELEVLHPVNLPSLRPYELMPAVRSHGLRALSLFSGGGGLDLGFARGGFTHVASYELMDEAASTIRRNRPEWTVYGGVAGDVKRARWKEWRGKVDVLHAGPPCQPFSHAGRQRGQLDARDCWPAVVAAIKAVQPEAFVCENVPALGSLKFQDYVNGIIVGPLERARPRWYVRHFVLNAWDFGVPQVRRRVIFVGFRSKADSDRFIPPPASHWWSRKQHGLRRTLGVREALGLPADEKYQDRLAPTIRSGLNGPRNTTSVLNSSSAAAIWQSVGIWPNGVAVDRLAASQFPADTGMFRLSVPDVALIQGFPASWSWPRAVYRAVGIIGNAVPPPLAWAVANAVGAALLG